LLDTSARDESALDIKKETYRFNKLKDTQSVNHSKPKECTIFFIIIYLHFSQCLLHVVSDETF
jgi:hypothetical protein